MPGYVWDHFAPSVKMSSYLVAFLVSDFISIPADPGTSNVQFRIWARANARDLTSCVILFAIIDKLSKVAKKIGWFLLCLTIRYSIDIGPRILEYYESYFNISYPLSKQDMAAIPDFASG